MPNNVRFDHISVWIDLVTDRIELYLVEDEEREQRFYLSPSTWLRPVWHEILSPANYRRVEIRDGSRVIVLDSSQLIPALKEARNLFPRHELSAAGFWYTLVEFRDDKPDIELKIDIPDLDNLQKVEIYGYEPLYYLEEDEPKAHAYLARLRGSKATESAELLSAEHIIAVRLTPTASDEAQLLDTFEQLIRLHYPG